MPRSTTVAPASSTRARSIGRLASRIWPGASGPRSTSSSPVDSTRDPGPGNDLDLGDVEAREHAEVGGAARRCRR